MCIRDRAGCPLDSNKYRKRLAGEDPEEYVADFAAEESDLIPAHFLYDAEDDQRACAYVLSLIHIWRI